MQNYIPVRPPNQENRNPRNPRNPRTNGLNLDSNHTNQYQTNQQLVRFGGELVSRDDYMDDNDIDRKYPHSHAIEHVIDNDDLDKNCNCTICLEQYKIGDKTVKLKCGHIFHKECLDPWLKDNNTCPTCRQIILQYYQD